MPFEYIRARSVEDAIAALREASGETKVIAGGQSLGPMLNLRLARPRRLVDIGSIDALGRIDRIGSRVRIGACVTHARIEDECGEHPGLAALAKAARGIAYRGVRNRGTIGGSLAHADPAADWPLVLAAFGAAIEVAGPKGRRRIDADAFMSGPYATGLASDEIVTAVEVTPLPAAARWAYRKFCRKPGEFAQAAVAVLFDPSARRARVFIGAPADRPSAIPALAENLVREGPGSAALERLGGTLDPVIGHAPPARQQACRAMLARALEDVFA